MSYRLLYADKAVRQLQELPAGLVDIVETNLFRLAGNPVSVSVPIVSLPFPPRGQLFHFSVGHPSGREWFFTVIPVFAGRGRAPQS